MEAYLRQLHDDLCNFYPITCLEAVVGGNIGAGTPPTEIDLTGYITEDFKSEYSEIKLYKYDDKMTQIVVEVERNPSYDINPTTENIIATGIPVTYIPERDIVLKTLTDDTNCKAVVVFKTTGDISLFCIPEERVDIEGDLVLVNPIMSMNQISSVGIILKE